MLDNKKQKNNDFFKINIGKNSINETVLKNINNAFNTKEYIKIHFLKTSNINTDKAISVIIDYTNSILVNKIGHSFTLYKKLNKNK